jgi:hypothetical protein
VCLYHGTDVESAAWIAQYGLNYERARLFGGGSFWATTDPDSATWCAYVNPAGGPPGLVRFELIGDVILSLMSRNPAWAIDRTLEYQSMQPAQTYEFLPSSFSAVSRAMTNATQVTITMTFNQ